MISAASVKELRELTGCGMMDCKKALAETDGNMEKAIEWLREKGLAAAAKKAGRIAAEGLVYASTNADNSVGVVVEVNSETDFVAKNEDFQNFVKGIADVVEKENPADVAALLEMNYPGSEGTVADMLREKILTIGENMNIRRFARYEGSVITYIHGGGRIGVMVNFDVDGAENDVIAELKKDVAMQVAAAMPQYLDRDSVPAEVVEKEKEILSAQALNEGKPANIVEKMVMGRINKFYQENCLIDQAFIKDNDLSIKKLLEAKSKETGVNIAIKGFVRFEKGEGLEKREDDFAAEVEKMAGKQ
ncbi:MAG: elongation factor Ts [Clostridia bacterium]|nr:elongation factor Ts [Clostridia bacterium]MBR2878650.1 elongation factor Ts [Clostridia bacterium]MBR2973896.1 elongation factor Ts [Clostridia bacterium]